MLPHIFVRSFVIVAVDHAAVEVAGERWLRPARIPVMPVSNKQGAVEMCCSIIQRDLPASTLQRYSMRHECAEANRRLDTEMLNIPIEILSDLRMMGKDGIIVGHGIIRVLHARS